MTRQEYDVVVEQDVKVPTRDRVNLAADVYHPVRNGLPLKQKRPTLLEGTP